MQKNTRVIDDQKVSTQTANMTSCNILTVEAGTNGHQGGDAGHGCRTYIRIEDEGGTSIRVKPLGNMWNDEYDGGVEIILAGDCELDTIIDGLKFITGTLEAQKKAQAK